MTALSLSLETLETVVGKVREIAAEQPDFKYQRDPDRAPPCVYRADDNNPHGCLIGYAFRESGHSIDSYTNPIGDLVTGSFSAPLELSPRDRAAWWLREVQLGQDGGSPWGECVAHADRVFNPAPPSETVPWEGQA